MASDLRRCVELVGRYSKIPPLPKRSLITSSDSRHIGQERQSVRRIYPVVRRLGPEVVAQLVADYQAGRTTGELVTQYRISHGSVVRLLHQHDVVMRNQGLSAEQIEQAAQLYRDGLSVAAIGKIFEIDGTTAWTALKKSGVQMRPGRGGPKRRLRGGSDGSRGH